MSLVCGILIWGWWVYNNIEDLAKCLYYIIHTNNSSIFLGSNTPATEILWISLLSTAVFQNGPRVPVSSPVEAS